EKGDRQEGGREDGGEEDRGAKDGGEAVENGHGEEERGEEDGGEGHGREDRHQEGGLHAEDGAEGREPVVRRGGFHRRSDLVAVDGAGELDAQLRRGGGVGGQRVRCLGERSLRAGERSFAFIQLSEVFWGDGPRAGRAPVLLLVE